MTEKLFTIESERIGSTYSIHIFKGDEIIFEMSNWESLSNMHKKECEEFVNYLNSITDENEQLKKELKFWKKLAKQCPMRSCKNSDTWYENNKKLLIDLFECNNFEEYD